MLKQVIVMRTDLNMRKGKMVAQGAHASMEFIRNKLGPFGKTFSDVEHEWLHSEEHAKICCQVKDLDELSSVCDSAVAVGLQVNFVTDFGLTEFKGVHTVTCAAIGPDDADKIDAITGHLKLL